MLKCKRIYYIDLLRTIACLSVVMIHVSASYVIKDFGTINFWIGNIFDSISRIGVPLFVMISGCLMLDEKYDLNKEKLVKHIKKLLKFFVFWSFFYCIVYQIHISVIMNVKEINFFEIVKRFFIGHYHLWYIYMIIGLYLISPILRLFVNKENVKYIRYFIVLSVIFNFIIPQIIYIGSYYTNWFEILNEMLEYINVKFVGGFTTYFILGWYLNNYQIEKKKVLYICGIISFILIVIMTGILSITQNNAIQMYGNTTITVLMYSVMVFYFIKEKFKVNNKEYDIINNISNYSLGIYAIHPFVIKIMYMFTEIIKCDIAIINIPIIFCITVLISYIGTYILSKIPILKTIV